MLVQVAVIKISLNKKVNNHLEHNIRILKTREMNPLNVKEIVILICGCQNFFSVKHDRSITGF